MSLRCLLLVAICVVFISTEGEEVKNVFGEVGGTVSFGLASISPPISSIIWKHKNSNGTVVKAIEWDVDDGVSISNQRFQGITTLDKETGEITIRDLNANHNGLYTIDINSKEQEQKFSLTVTGEEVKNVFGEVGGTVSFGLASISPPISSIIWKHKNSNGTVVKVIEWDVDDGVSISNQRFQGITALDEKTGEITIINLKVEHSGTYIIEVGSKEQEQRFSLEVLERVPKPVITIEESSNPDVAYLRCEYSGTIIWKNSAGETLKGSEHHPTGESITVEKKGNPENYYTCTLDNGASPETSDPVYERDLFKG